MGNAGSGGAPRERQKSGETVPSSPSKDGQAFVFDKKPDKLLFQGSQEDEDSYYSKTPASVNFEVNRPRANTGINIDKF